MFPRLVGGIPHRGNASFTSISEGDQAAYGRGEALQVRRFFYFSLGEGEFTYCCRKFILHHADVARLPRSGVFNFLM